MFADDAHKLQVLRQWVVVAEEDLQSAAHLLKSGKRVPATSVCFHAQQCIENYLKAALVDREIDFLTDHWHQRLHR